MDRYRDTRDSPYGLSLIVHIIKIEVTRSRGLKYRIPRSGGVAGKHPCCQQSENAGDWTGGQLIQGG